MYTLKYDNRNNCIHLQPILDANCDYYISPNLHVESFLKTMNANIYGNLQVDCNATIYKDLTLYGNLHLVNGNINDFNSEVKVSDSMIITGDAINDSLVVCQNSLLKDIAVFKNASTNIFTISPNNQANLLANLNVTGNINITSPGRIRNTIGNIDPSVGDIKMSVRNSDFDGWILCNGRSLSTATYPQLFALIGYTFGGSGATFVIPNALGQTLGSAGGSYSFGTAVGSSTATLSTANLPPHTHSGTTSTEGLHAHTSNANGGYGGLGLVTADGSNTVTSADSSPNELNVWTNPIALSINNNGSHNHAFTTDNGPGSSTAFSIMQPTLFMGYTFIYGGV